MCASKVKDEHMEDRLYILIESDLMRVVTPLGL